MADVAQLVEPLIVVQVVVGSSPIVRPNTVEPRHISVSGFCSTTHCACIKLATIDACYETVFYEKLE